MKLYIWHYDWLAIDGNKVKKTIIVLARTTEEAIGLASGKAIETSMDSWELDAARNAIHNQIPGRLTEPCAIKL